MRPYQKNPEAIYQESFATVVREANLDRFPNGLDKLATRVIHACGMIDIADRLAFSEKAFIAGANALVDGATSCTQSLLWECYGSGLWTGGANYGYFYGRGNIETYWPGGTAQCDLNDNVWRSNGGEVTNRGDLPITRVRFGDTGDAGEQGYHTVGKLKCR